ncbi:MAG: hypothetical protein KGI08_11140, partial [Thaumarchaeota archaeon]|nr:hypothetical protein [Nitrososphaerota archaeon]
MQATADFETTITVADQIQQVSVSNLSADKLTVFLVNNSRHILKLMHVKDASGNSSWTQV